MYCDVCKCEFEGWTDTCPNCQNSLVDAKPPELSASVQAALSYDDLVKLVRENDGQLKIDLIASDSSRQKKHGFPYLGYGYAWVKGMQGQHKSLRVELHTTEVGKAKSHSFPYFGYGFAWSKKMEGTLAGNAIVLSASRVERNTSRAFPYLGYGYAWTQEMIGQCGESLKVKLTVTDVAQQRTYGFPYFGFGFAWENKGMLTLSFVE